MDRPHQPIRNGKERKVKIRLSKYSLDLRYHNCLELSTVFFNSRIPSRTRDRRRKEEGQRITVQLVCDMLYLKGLNKLQDNPTLTLVVAAFFSNRHLKHGRN